MNIYTKTVYKNNSGPHVLCLCGFWNGKTANKEVFSDQTGPPNVAFSIFQESNMTCKRCKISKLQYFNIIFVGNFFSHQDSVHWTEFNYSNETAVLRYTGYISTLIITLYCPFTLACIYVFHIY